MKKIAVFASGEGTNADNIAAYFSDSDIAEVALLLTDKSDAPVIERMNKYGVETVFFEKSVWRNGSEDILSLLRQRGIDLIVLAGFTSFVSDTILSEFRDRVINLHPSLLPKFGGKGMWGMNVHRAVIAAGESESGITVHYVSSEIDGGRIIRQFKCRVDDGDTPESLAAKIHQLEYRHFPAVIFGLLTSE